MAASTEVDLRPWDNGGGIKFQIKVTEAGYFRAYQVVDPSEPDPKDPELYAQADTLEKLLTDIAPKVKRQARRINVPFSIWDKGDGAGYQKDFTGTVRHATVVGVHGGTGNYLVRWEDTGKTTQERDYNLSGALSRLSETEVAQLAATYAAAQAAQDDVYTLRKVFGTSLKKRVAEAFAALQGEVG